MAAFTKRLRLADDERTAHLSFSVSPACVLKLDQTSKGRCARLAWDLRKPNTAVKWEARSPRTEVQKDQRGRHSCAVPVGWVPHVADGDEGGETLAVLVLISPVSVLTRKFSLDLLQHHCYRGAVTGG